MIQIHFAGNEMYILTVATQWAIVFSGIFLWIGMLTGVWKYYQIRHTERARAHYYILILATLSHFTVLSNPVALLCVLANLFFFSLAILSYILHGLLQDTTNQFKQPHQLGYWTLPSWCMTFMMVALIIAELSTTTILLIGTIFKFLT